MEEPKPEEKNENCYKKALETIAGFTDVFDCASCAAQKIAEEALKEPELNLEEGSAKVTLQDVYALFYILLRQNQKLHPGSKMSFDLNVFKGLPKQVKVNFQRKNGRLFAWIPEKPKDRKKVKKSRLWLPTHKIVTPN